MRIGVFTLFLFLHIQLFASHYNSTILELEAKIFPKMLMLCENLADLNRSVHISIIVQEQDKHYAQELKTAIDTHYKQGLMDKRIEVSINQFQTLTHKPEAVIIFHHAQKEVEEIAQWANTHKIVSFAYEPSYLEYGVLASIYLGASTKPYINTKTLKEYNFIINPYLLKLSKLY
ncbi:MAG: hypothetical protein JXQ67_08455 [Campylobacterales bacterium]|nr:hypothetical protein [Campylobacterales bacterium]